MPIPIDPEELRAMFERLGADSAHWMRRSDHVNQMHRFLFLRQAWKNVVEADDDAWIDVAIANAAKEPDSPDAAIGHALARLLASGASRSDLVAVVRGKQVGMLFGICYTLEDPAFAEEEVDDVGWVLVERGSDYEPTTRELHSLHEWVFDVNPAEATMRQGGDS